MKTLAELGISPAPWYVGETNKKRALIDNTGFILANTTGNPCDADLLTAAPDLYECLYEAVEYHCSKCPAHGCGCNKDCLFYKWRAALEKAGG